MEQEELQKEFPEGLSSESLTGTETDSPKDKNPEEKEKTSFLYDVYSLLHDLVYMLAAITLIFVFCVRLVGVNGESMLPTLYHNDYLALQSNVIMGDLEYGDVIVAREMDFKQGEPIVKRVIATENQTVLIQKGNDGYAHVYVDGELLDEPYILEGMDSYDYYFEQDNDNDPDQFTFTVSPGHIFVMGDNRNNSADSRLSSIGEIKLDQVLGKVLMIVLPGADENGQRDWSRFGVVS